MASGNWALDARKASNLSPEACAAAIGKSRPRYDDREKNPGTLTVNEIRSLSQLYNEQGRKILWNYLQRFRA